MATPKRGSVAFSMTSGSVPTPGVVKCDSRRPAISVNHEVTLNRSLMNSSPRPPVTAAEDGPKFWQLVPQSVKTLLK